MKIDLYPNFEEVFTDDTLKGIFYPLCSLTLEKYPNKVFHFISSNGLWMDEKFETKENTSEYTLFEIQENKYKFKGDLKLYLGFEQAKIIFNELQKDFDENGKEYLEKKTKTEDYIETQKRNIKIRIESNFDIDYYLQTFYEFSIMKLIFQLTNEFGAFRLLMEKNWSKSDSPSPIIYDETTDELKGTLNHFDKPKIGNFETFEVIGKIVGCEFFTDGNDTVLFYNNLDEILCLNFYS